MSYKHTVISEILGWMDGWIVGARKYIEKKGRGNKIKASTTKDQNQRVKFPLPRENNRESFPGI